MSWAIVRGASCAYRSPLTIASSSKIIMASPACFVRNLFRHLGTNSESIEEWFMRRTIGRLIAVGVVGAIGSSSGNHGSGETGNCLAEPPNSLAYSLAIRGRIALFPKEG